ncbi:hypothetical protein IKL45_01255 [Candidatus Saccharibacteria bacterium]|nr:hypothetical protein [Candidatus Saccharibacteria bacterium]MBR6123106.1 hypothetical protein [Candidatus Saccharibacteria bacterium]
MESHAFSHNDEQYRITAEPGHYLELFFMNPDKTLSDFIPPQENSYDQILRVKFGLDQNTFQKLRNNRLPSWKISEVIFYGAAMAIRHEHIYDKPILTDPGVRPRHGVRVEQIFTETIPYDNISTTDFTLKVKLVVAATTQARAGWTIPITKDKVFITPPGGMGYELQRIRL